MSRLLLFFGMFLLLASSVCALSAESDLNLSVDNVSSFVTLNVTLLENETMFVSPLVLDSRLNYSYPDQLYFSNATETLRINVSSVYEFVSDEVVNSSFNLTNSLNNNSYEFVVTTNVFADPHFNESKEFFIDVVNGEYFVNISTNLIPKTGSLAYRINGLSGEVLEISCPVDTWLSCPVNSTFGVNNATQFNINYSIPEDAPIGLKNYSVVFRTGNITLNKSILFNIYEPDLILQQYVFDEACFVEDVNGDLTLTYDCILEYQAFQYEQTVQIINKLREEKNKNCKVVENVTEHVYVGNVEEEVLDQLNICRSDRDSARDDFNTCQSKLSEKENLLGSCNTDLKNAERKLLNNETTCLENVFATSVKLKEDAARDRNETMQLAKEYRSKTVWTLILLVFLFLLVVGFFIYQKAVKKEAWS